jgi:hypothetical protein
LLLGYLGENWEQREPEQKALHQALGPGQMKGESTHYRSNSAPNNVTKQDRRRNAVLGKLQAAAGRLQRGALVGAQLGVTLDSRRSPLKAIKPNIVEEFAYYGIK